MTDCKTVQSTSGRSRTAAPFTSTASWCDVTEHQAFRLSVKSAAMLYDYQAQPENIELMTFSPDGSNRRINRAWQMPRNYAEMLQRRKAMQAWARLSYGFIGARRTTSPPPWSASAWESRCSRSTDQARAGVARLFRGGEPNDYSSPT